MRLREATERATRSPNGDGRAREHRATGVPARSRRRSLPWLLLGVLLVAGCALAFALASVRLSGRQPVLELVRSVPAGIDRVETYELGVTVSEVSDLFDGSERLVSLVAVPWFVRQETD